MNNNQKKYLTIAAVALAVIIIDKATNTSTKLGTKLGLIK